MVPQNIPSVPDLVEISSDNDKKTLPSSNDLRIQTEGKKELPRLAEPERVFKRDKPKDKSDDPASPLEDAKDREPKAMEVEENGEDKDERSKSGEQTDKGKLQDASKLSFEERKSDSDRLSPVRSHTHNSEITSEDSPKEIASQSSDSQKETTGSANLNSLMNHSTPPDTTEHTEEQNHKESNDVSEHTTPNSEGQQHSDGEKKGNGKTQNSEVSEE
jgi:hypothetical protein